MAHIHLEDGAFSLEWAILWWVAAIVLIFLCIYWARQAGRADNRKYVMAAMLTAASFAIFQVNIPLFGGVHMNLTALLGILAGPALGGIVVLCVNVLSAAIGHGGWGLIGANVIVNLAEVTIAYLVYRWLRSTGIGTFSRAGVATLSGLTAGNAIMILIIAISGIQGSGQDSLTTMYGLALLAAVNMGVALIESIVTGYIVAYVEKIRPDLLGEVIRVAPAVR
jgi:ABC-type Co2+ transport system, permease component